MLMNIHHAHLHACILIIILFFIFFHLQEHVLSDDDDDDIDEKCTEKLQPLPSKTVTGKCVVLA